MVHWGIPHTGSGYTKQPGKWVLGTGTNCVLGLLYPKGQFLLDQKSYQIMSGRVSYPPFKSLSSFGGQILKTYFEHKHELLILIRDAKSGDGKCLAARQRDISG